MQIDNLNNGNEVKIIDMNVEGRMEKYILRTNIKGGDKYVMVVDEAQALFEMIRAGHIFEAIRLAFDYGMAKGYRLAKKEECKV